MTAVQQTLLSSRGARSSSICGRIKYAPFVTLAGIQLAAACGGETTDSGPDFVPLGDMPQRLAEASCRIMFYCCTPSEIVAKLGVTDESTCTTVMREILASGAAQLQASVQSMRVEYRGDHVASCIRTLSCADFLDGTAECEDFLIPLVTQGGECSADFDCTTGFCDGSSSASGVCSTPPKLGEACDFICEEDAYCGDMATCIPQRPNGDPCSESAECQSNNCDVNNVCTDSGLCG